MGKIINSWRDEFDNGLDSDLIGDDDDRDRLEDMTEKQREEELFKRAERREELKKRYEISKKLGLQQKSKPPPSDSEKSLESKSGSEDDKKSGSDKGSDSDKASGGEKGSDSSRGSDSNKGSDSENNFSSFPGSRQKGYEEKHAKKFSALTDLKAKR